MIIDCRSKDWDRKRRHVFLNGVEKQSVWYSDDEKGIIKTYEVFPGQIATAVNKGNGDLWTPADFSGREVEAPPDGVLSETLHGVVVVTEWE